MDLKKVFDSVCAVPGSVGAVMVREDGSIFRSSGRLCQKDEAHALSLLAKDAAQLMAMVQPAAGPLSRVTISRPGEGTVVATVYQDHVTAVKLAKR
ncbi:hypothetical protein H4R18_001757 [Coemansia javaensis]|uniref:Uncharacterized protein n=1 Tax=Coemansia javaensis TaxID=2761396 RepID=A0A9W8HG86_9FUNG|nr:hypothetical protein H4R18_001757 [Coemansia javaensis]